MQPLQGGGDSVPVDQEASEKEAIVISTNAVGFRTYRITYLNSIIRVPTKLATLVLANDIDSKRITLAVVKLNSTSVNMNFQKAGTVGTRPTRP